MDPESPTPQNPDQAPEPQETPPTPVAPQPAPPAAEIVVKGTKTEREATLERDLKTRETRIAELEDENHRLKTPPTPQPTVEEKRSWLSGATFFEE